MRERRSSTTRWQRLAALAAALLCLGASRDPLPEANPAAQRLLEAAFVRRYACTITGVVHIAVRKGEARARDRRIHFAAKFVKGKLHTYAIFREPHYVRGMAFLGVESDDPHLSEQQFVYLPSMGKVRRVSGSQPTDSFLGSDLSYADFQRQHPERYRASEVRPGSLAGESIRTVLVTPLFDAPYANVEYEIATVDTAILGARFRKRPELEPYKFIRIPRADIISNEECAVPRRVIVDDRHRGTRTDLEITELRTNADLDDTLFTYTALEARREIPGIKDR